MAATLRDYYNTGDNSYSLNTAPNGQTFTTTESYILTSVKLKLYRDATAPGTLTVNIYATSEELPTGGVLASGTTNGNTLTENTDGEWREITLTSSYALVSGTKYAIVLATNANAGFRYYSMPETYEGGDYVYFDDPNWVVYGGADWMFETWGTDAYVFSPPADRVTYKRLVAAASNKIWYESV